MTKTIPDEEWVEVRKGLLQMEMLKDKVAVIYGAAGAVGSTAARAFAGEGARVFLTGRSTSKLNKVAEEISSAGLSAEVAEVDALDDQGVNHHLEKIFENTGTGERPNFVIKQILKFFGDNATTADTKNGKAMN